MHKVRSEVTGSVWKVEVAIGQRVVEGDTLLIVEAMKVMNPILAPNAGVVKMVLVTSGQPVEFDDSAVQPPFPVHLGPDGIGHLPGK